MAKFYKRRIVREKVLQILYAYELNQESHSITKAEILKDIENENDKNFAEDLIKKKVMKKLKRV